MRTAGTHRAWLLAHPHALFGGTGEPEHGRAELRLAARIHEERGVAGDLGHGRHVRGDHRRAARHRFHDR
jgi:hypothetical protein